MAAQDRNLAELIDKIILLIPADVHYDFLHTALESCQSSARCAAPEAMYLWWEEGSQILAEFLPRPDCWEEWQRKIYNLWMDRPLDAEIKVG